MGKIWVAVSGYEVQTATTLKGACQDIEGISYNTVKLRAKEGVFTVVVGDGVNTRVWFFVNTVLRKVAGRGGKRKQGFKIIR